MTLVTAIISDFLLQQTHYFRCHRRALIFFDGSFRLPQKITRAVLCNAFISAGVNTLRYEDNI